MKEAEVAKGLASPFGKPKALPGIGGKDKRKKFDVKSLVGGIGGLKTDTLRDSSKNKGGKLRKKVFGL